MAERRAESEATRADREKAAVTAALAQLEGVRADLDAARDSAGDMRSTMATLTAEREAARADVERERAHGDQRVKDIHETYGRQIDQLREEIALARRETTPERRTSKAPTAGKD